MCGHHGGQPSPVPLGPLASGAVPTEGRGSRDICLQLPLCRCPPPPPPPPPPRLLLRAEASWGSRDLCVRLARVCSQRTALRVADTTSLQRWEQGGCGGLLRVPCSKSRPDTSSSASPASGRLSTPGASAPLWLHLSARGTKSGAKDGRGLALSQAVSSHVHDPMAVLATVKIH